MECLGLEALALLLGSESLNELTLVSGLLRSGRALDLCVVCGAVLGSEELCSSVDGGVSCTLS